MTSDLTPRPALAAGIGALILLLLSLQMPAIAQSITYIHTDALGTPVAVTDSDRKVIEVSEYEPYGKLLNRSLTDAPGFTGHVSDAGTGLNYMQQRYYDPVIGRFLSVDPVTAEDGDMRHFNRYIYGYDNPYKFTDPDGRCPMCATFAIGFAIDVGKQMIVDGKPIQDVDLGDAAGAGLVSAFIPGLANLGKVGIQSAKVAGSAAKAITKVAAKSANTANRASKNAATIGRNVEKIKSATADVGKAAVVAGAHQVVKSELQSRTPEVKASGVKDAVKPPPPPPDDHNK